MTDSDLIDHPHPPKIQRRPDTAPRKGDWVIVLSLPVAAALCGVLVAHLLAA